jgi:protein-S-isoprenylcysteine O-methyltransferase Ste14
MSSARRFVGAIDSHEDRHLKGRARMATSSDPVRPPEPIDRRRLFLGVAWSLLMYILCLFLPAGTWMWFRGWLFFLVLVATSVVMTWYLYRVNPDVIAGRVNRHEGTKTWDRWVLVILIPALVAVLVVPALDDGRYHWLPVGWWVCAVGYFLLCIGMAGFAWAESVNRFFEPTVRIQTDRGHTVVNTGPYAIVRHPGYVAGCLLFLGIPLCLGSIWGLIPAALSCLILVVRTILEDRMLRTELPGYEEYAQRVRYKWIPGVW